MRREMPLADEIHRLSRDLTFLIGVRRSISSFGNKRSPRITERELQVISRGCGAFVTFTGPRRKILSPQRIWPVPESGRPGRARRVPYDGAEVARETRRRHGSEEVGTRTPSSGRDAASAWVNTRSVRDRVAMAPCSGRSPSASCRCGSPPAAASDRSCGN